MINYQQKMMGKRLLIISLIFLITLAFVGKTPVLAADTENGEKIFNVHCVGCHPNGNNIIRRGKNLKKKALHRYGMDSPEAIKNIVTNGKNNMSAYQDRLSKQEIEDVAVYVLKQAEKNWH